MKQRNHISRKPFSRAAICFSVICTGAALTHAEIPEGYYSALQGKSGDELAAAVKAAATQESYKTLTYSSGTWPAFANTDVRTWQGLQIWWDMYSNEIVTTEAHDGLNIEHCVANSWWGGVKTVDPYKDLFNLNPSNEAANNQKGNLPLGVVANAAFDNGLIKTGTPVSGVCGSANKVFEPADEYKGDFARAYLYTFTVHSDVAWKDATDMYTLKDGKPQLTDWAAKLLLEWNAQDPVDTKEYTRNEAVYSEQKNRNPFIDYPELADYLWGSRKGETYTPAKAASPVDRPQAPLFDGFARKVNTYFGDWWADCTIPVTATEGDLWVSIDGGNYQRFGDAVKINAASTAGQQHTLRAYTEWENEGVTLRSPVSTLNLTAVNPDAESFSTAVWEPVTDLSGIDTNSYYLILSASNHHAMSSNLISNRYMADDGIVGFRDDDVTRIFSSTALARFTAHGSDSYTLSVCNAAGTSLGFWNQSSSGNTMSLDADRSTPLKLSFANGQANIEFSGKSLKYNKSQPRFSNYGSNSSTSAGILLYRFKEYSSGVELIPDTPGRQPVAVDGNTILAPQGSAVYDLSGRRVSGLSLRPGIYIVAVPSGATVKIVFR